MAFSCLTLGRKYRAASSNESGKDYGVISSISDYV